MSIASSPAQQGSRYGLDQHREFGDLLGLSLRIWFANPAAFLLVAIAIVLPIDLIVVGALGGGFSDPDGDATQAMTLLDQALIGWIATAVITAAHARAIVALDAGERVTPLSALRIGSVLGTVLVVGACYGLAATIGLLALVIPGIFVWVAGAFAAPTAALTRSGPLQSLDASLHLVRAAGWWGTFGYLLLVYAIALVSVVAMSFGLIVAVELVTGPVTGTLMVVGVGVLSALMLSWIATAVSLRYFSSRAKVGQAFGAAMQPGAPENFHAGPDRDLTAAGVVAEPAVVSFEKAEPGAQ